MKAKLLCLAIVVALLSCEHLQHNSTTTAAPKPIVGTWKLLRGTLIEKGDTTVTDYTKNISFIKIINDTHFSFLQHDLGKPKDSTSPLLAGGGTYSLKDSTYTEHLEYCSDRVWEGHDFSFTITLKNDTLTQSGIEKVEGAGVNRMNIEKYVRVQ